MGGRGGEEEARLELHLVKYKCLQARQARGGTSSPPPFPNIPEIDLLNEHPDKGLEGDSQMHASPKSHSPPLPHPWPHQRPVPMEIDQLMGHLKALATKGSYEQQTWSLWRREGQVLACEVSTRASSVVSAVSLGEPLSRAQKLGRSPLFLKDRPC